MSRKQGRYYEKAFLFSHMEASAIMEEKGRFRRGQRRRGYELLFDPVFIAPGRDYLGL